MGNSSIIFSIIIGTFLGSLAGLLPGLHPNTVSQFLSSINIGDEFLLAAIIIVSAAVNNIIALLPAIFLFVPDSDSVLSILPAQRMALKGEGRLAVLVCAFSAMVTLLFLIFVLPLSFLFLPLVYQFLSPYLAYILIFLSIIFIYQDKDRLKEASFVFLIAGIFGILILSTPISSLLQEPLFSVFVGFFAMSSLLLSMGEKALIPKQKDVSYRIEFGRNFFLIVLLSTLIGAFADIFPTINSPAQLATFVSPLAKTPLLFLSSTTSITVSHYANSIVAFERIGKARTGTLINIGEIIQDINFNLMFWLVAFYFAGTIIGIVLFLFFSEYVIKIINKIDQKLMNTFLLFFLVFSVLLFSGIFGILILILSTFIGLLPPLLGVRRTHLMAFLILPTILIIM